MRNFDVGLPPFKECCSCISLSVSDSKCLHENYDGVSHARKEEDGEEECTLYLPVIYLDKISHDEQIARIAISKRQ